MQDDPIRAALREAARGMDAYIREQNAKLGIVWDAAPEITTLKWEGEAAAAIAAFLRALPAGWHMDKARDDLAAAVERAAKGSEG